MLVFGAVNRVRFFEPKVPNGLLEYFAGLPVLRSESPSKRAKLHTVAASNNRDHSRRYHQEVQYNQLFTRFTSIVRGHSPRSLYQNHSFIACSRHICMGVILRAHPVRGESHIQGNASGEVATPVTGSQFMPEILPRLHFGLVAT